MTDPGPTKEEYDSLIYKLATLESGLGQARKLLEAPKKVSWWKRLWGMGSKAAVVALVVAILTSGCAVTLSEIRTKEPSQIISSTKTPQELSKCIEFKMRAELGGGLIVNREEYPNNTYRIALQQAADGSTPFGGLASSALTDILVKPTDSGSVVEFRKWDWSSASFQSKLIEIAERCAK